MTAGKTIKKLTVRSAVVHMFFENLHLFADGNGNIGCALAERLSPKLWALWSCLASPAP
ncbi:Fic family protein [Pontibacter mangrovi]|uniref:Fido domain-containing protein n=1 Tax=Pontibacter mangrovi TaxID=2589816 RepID=A0A501W500_9BACT|nr:hypothetical protein FJM65_09255 [Pontibacter mangrovi]